MVIGMRKKVLVPLSEEEVPATPPEVEAIFGDDTTATARRRSLQVSMSMNIITLTQLMSFIVGMNFSVIIRLLLSEYLNIIKDILIEEGFLNSYGNIFQSLDRTTEQIGVDRISILKKFVDRCEERKISTSWVNKSEL